MRVISKYFSTSFLDAKLSSCLLSSSERDSSHGFKNKPFLSWYKGQTGALPLSLLGPELDEPGVNMLKPGNAGCEFYLVSMSAKQFK